MHGLNEIRKLNAVNAKRTDENIYGGRETNPPHQPRPYNDPSTGNHQERIESAIDQKEGSPFLTFWRGLNAKRVSRGEQEAMYGEARKLFNGLPTPDGALVLAELGDGLRAVPAVSLGHIRTWHGEYREANPKAGIVWHRVYDGSGEPICYTDPLYAITVAARERGARISKGYR